MAALPGRRRAWRRYRMSFRRMSLCIVWRLGFRQSSFRHITRVPRRPGPDTWARRRFAGMRLFRSPLGSGLAIRPTNLPSSSSRLGRGYNRAPRGALESHGHAHGVTGFPTPGRSLRRAPLVAISPLGTMACSSSFRARSTSTRRPSSKRLRRVISAGLAGRERGCPPEPGAGQQASRAALLH